MVTTLLIALSLLALSGIGYFVILTKHKNSAQGMFSLLEKEGKKITESLQTLEDPLQAYTKIASSTKEKIEATTMNFQKIQRENERDQDRLKRAMEQYFAKERLKTTMDDLKIRYEERKQKEDVYKKDVQELVEIHKKFVTIKNENQNRIQKTNGKIEVIAKDSPYSLQYLSHMNQKLERTLGNMAQKEEIDPVKSEKELQMMKKVIDTLEQDLNQFEVLQEKIPSIPETIEKTKEAVAHLIEKEQLTYVTSSPVEEIEGMKQIHREMVHNLENGDIKQAKQQYENMKQFLTNAYQAVLNRIAAKKENEEFMTGNDRFFVTFTHMTHAMRNEVKEMNETFQSPQVEEANRSIHFMDDVFTRSKECYEHAKELHKEAKYEEAAELFKELRVSIEQLEDLKEQYLHIKYTMNEKVSELQKKCGKIYQELNETNPEKALEWAKQVDEAFKKKPFALEEVEKMVEEMDKVGIN